MQSERQLCAGQHSTTSPLDSTSALDGDVVLEGPELLHRATGLKLQRGLQTKGFFFSVATGGARTKELLGLFFVLCKCSHSWWEMRAVSAPNS